MCYLLKTARKLFDEITKRNLHIRNSIYRLYFTSTLHEYTGYKDSVEFYHEKDNVFLWTYKISQLVRKKQHERAIGLFKTMLLSDQRPNFVTLVSLIRALGAFSCQVVIRVAHAYVIKLGFELEAPVVTALLGLYSMFDIGIACKLFEHSLHKDVVLWSAMVSACVKNEKYKEAIHYFRRMLYYGMEANHVTVISVLPAGAHLGGLCFVNQIHGFSIKRVFYSLTNVQNSLVDVYAKSGELKASISLFNGMWQKDLVSWRTMICMCIENECPREGLNIFLKMQYSNIEPDEIIIRHAILASVQAKEIKFGLGFHACIEKNGFLAFISVGTSLLQMYAKYGKFGSARMVFDQLDNKDLIAWSAIISVHARGGQPHDALSAFKQMQSINEKPNKVTFVSLLQACTALGAQELGESIHGFVTKAGYSSNIYLKSCLIDLYCKLGRIKQGKALFDETSTKDVVCWSSMIKGYGWNGYGFEALETFSKMLNCGVKPNDTVFLSVLSACSQCGLEHEGRRWFYSMQEKHGITPKLAHYACMVDLLSRQGNIEEALKFVKEMPVEPDKRIWGALLAGCRSKCEGSTKVAEFVFQQLSALDPEDTSCYETL